MLIIGDVHAKIEEFARLIEKDDSSIQLGDFGFIKSHEWFEKNRRDTDFINFGNHDYWPFIKKNYSLKYFGYNEKTKIFNIAGANSIDKINRTEYIDWFKEEELSNKDCNNCIDLYTKIKPEIVISHDCPKVVSESFFNLYYKSKTNQLLQSLFEIHKPILWIFGHHHKSKNELIESTRFICLNELETYHI